MRESNIMQLHATINRASKFSGGARLVAVLSALVLVHLIPATRAEAQSAVDPGPRGAPVNAGGFVTGLNTYQQQIETPMTSFIEEVNVVAGGTSTKRVGLGARWDSNSCTG